jgi:hypothetical protein
VVGHRRRPGLRCGLLAGATLVFAVVAGTAPSLSRIVSIGLFLVVGSIVTRPCYLLLDAGLVGSVVVVVLTLSGEPAWSGTSVGLVMLGSLALGCGLWRDRTGVAGAIGGAAVADAMLVDLRERSLLLSTTPELVGGWRMDADLRSAHGASFSGDFVVTGARAVGRLDVVLVDVSGSGQAAGSRALLLAGAFEALLDAVPGEEFMAAANRHVLRHGDDEGFATAVQVSLDLVTGRFLLIGAGHPPAVQYRAGAVRWEVLSDADQGPALGLLIEPRFPARVGRLDCGDVLLLYTDGLVESRRLDVDRGIDRLIARADAVLPRAGAAAAAEIATAIRAEDGDDRALVVIRRS